MGGIIVWKKKRPGCGIIVEIYSHNGFELLELVSCEPN